MDILKDAWSPVLTLKTALISLQSLLCDPAPNDPQDAQVARHYLSDIKGFEETARQWTKLYAMGPSSSAHSEAVQRLQEMGFEKSLVIRALKQFDGDETRAIDAIVSGNVF